jgi:hypothetical protein
MAYNRSLTKRDVIVTTGSQYTFGKGTHGRTIKFRIHPMRNGIQVSRPGRRGGIRSDQKARGGMVVCTAEGERSRCIKSKDLIIFPGGSAKVKKWGSSMMLNGYGSRRRRRRRR